jgi:hypothetical protein
MICIITGERHMELLVLLTIPHSYINNIHLSSSGYTTGRTLSRTRLLTTPQVLEFVNKRQRCQYREHSYTAELLKSRTVYLQTETFVIHFVCMCI